MGKTKGKGKGRAARNAQTKQKGNDEDGHYAKAPHSFVFHRGHVGRTVKDLVKDVRKIMEPYTASKLKVRKKNVMKDFLAQAGPLHVSHFLVFTKTEVATYLRLICVPRGPTLTFKVNEFCLARDVISAQKNIGVDEKHFKHHAVMVTNLPADNQENKLMNEMFKNMFPSINPNTVKLNDMRRTVLVNYDKESKSIDVRHYTMKVVPKGISRAMKKLMKPKLPDMSRHADIADLFLAGGLSDSEGEQDGPHSEVTVTQRLKDRGVAPQATNAIRLKEIGPRLNLQLLKIEEGFEAGNILYHAFVTKTPAELEALKALKEQKRKERFARKQRQEANVKKKKEDKEAQVKKTLQGMERKKAQTEAEKSKSKEEEDADNDYGDGDANNNKKEMSDSEDDFDYYKQEVGQDPAPEMFTKKVKRKRPSDEPDPGPKSKRQMKKAAFSHKSSKYQEKKKPQSKFSMKISTKEGKHQTKSPGKKDFHRSPKSGKKGFSGKSQSNKKDFTKSNKGKKPLFKGKNKRK